ncbi:MAG: O-antigen/teichoic acid export membrane protein [Cognaticolwellia sp.]
MSLGVLKSTYYSSVSIYFEYLLGLVISILVARSLGVEAFGLYGYLVKVAGIAIILTNAGIGIGAIKFIAEARAGGAFEEIYAIHAYFKRIQHIKILVVTGAIAALTLFFPGLLVEPEYQHLIVFLLFSVVFKSAHMYRVGVLKGFERFDFLAFIVLVVAPLNLIAVAVAYFFDASLSLMFSIFAGVSVLYYIVSEFYVRKLVVSNNKYKSPELSKSLKIRIKHHLKVVSINTVVSVLVLGQCEVLLLKHFVSNEAVALFNIASILSNAAISLVPGVYSLILLPIIAKSVTVANGNPAFKISESVRYLFVLAVMVAVPSFVYGESIVILLYGSDFAEAGWVFGTLTLVGVLIAFRDPINAYLMSTDNQSILLKFSFYALIMSLTINYFFISTWGLKGAVLAFTIVSVVLTFLLVNIVRKLLKIEIDYKKLGMTLLASALTMAIVFVLSSSFSGGAEVVIGFIAFGLLYSVNIILFNCLTESDYDMILLLSKKGGQKVERFFMFLVSSRLNK